MKAKYLVALAALSCAATSANAAVTISAVPGSDPYAGPTPTYDFDLAGQSLVTGGGFHTGNTASGAPPVGSTGNYWSVGPGAVGAPPTSTPGFLDLSSWAQIGQISFIWGSTDAYNTLEVLRRDNTVMAGGTFTGSSVALPADGNQTALLTNPLVTLTFTGLDQSDIGGLRLSSTQNAFETDNFAIQAVPEPGTWLMLLLGFGLVGGVMRASKKRETGPRVRYAF